MKDNSLIPILESDKEAFFPPTSHHVHGLGDQRSGHNTKDHNYILAYANDIAQTKKSKQEEEIKNRIAKYIQNVGCMNRLLKDRNVPKKAKQIIHQTILRPILIFE